MKSNIADIMRGVTTEDLYMPQRVGGLLDSSLMNRIENYFKNSSVGGNVQKKKNGIFWTADDIRTGVSNKIEGKTPGENVDHVLELQTIAKAMNKCNILPGSKEAYAVKLLANRIPNLRLISQTENLQKAWRTTYGVSDLGDFLGGNVVLDKMEDNSYLKPIFRVFPKVHDVFQASIIEFPTYF